MRKILLGISISTIAALSISYFLLTDNSAQKANYFLQDINLENDEGNIQKEFICFLAKYGKTYASKEVHLNKY